LHDFSFLPCSSTVVDFFDTIISLKFLLAQILISFVAQHLCVRTNLIYDPLKQNKQSSSVHILVVIA